LITNRSPWLSSLDRRGLGYWVVLVVVDRFLTSFIYSEWVGRKRSRYESLN
jgi:hypothetical protein